MHSHDVVIVGAGAAGIGAGLELAGTDLSFVVLEAADRVGGRALTDASTLPVAWDHGCHWLHSADINPLVAWADRLGAVYRTEDRVDHFAIWQAGRFVSAAELAGARAAPLAAFDAIEAAAEAENDVSIQEILPDAGRWNAGVRCVLQTMAGANPEEVSAPDYVDGEDTDLNWPVISGYGDLFARMASNLPIKLNVRVEKVLQRAGSVTLDTSAGTISAKAAIITASTSVLASGSIGFSPGPASELLDIIADLPCGKYEKVALAVTDLPPETAGKIFCMIDPGSGARAIDFQIMSTSPPVLIAHLAGDAAGPAIDEGGPAMIALATERLVQAFGNDFRRGIIASGTSDWSHNPLILGSYSNARPRAARQRRRAISMETDNIVFAGEAFSPYWTGAAHGAYESGREQARRLALRMKREVG
ncbi:flavin monoamine oxidase family protein [Rhodophyticola sp.]|jgi:monoamine oxidase|uniref:flavin monoamine oxidase family protein n=1 Tax=Rhodophyticola sp. TaxID=2680032 RepID=UPI003D2824F5